MALTVQRNYLVVDDLSTKLGKVLENHQQTHKLVKGIDFLSQLIYPLPSGHCPSIFWVSEEEESLQGQLTERLFVLRNSQHGICSAHCPLTVSFWLSKTMYLAAAGSHSWMIFVHQDRASEVGVLQDLLHHSRKETVRFINWSIAKVIN